jgi:hypothetical protein
VFRVPLCEFAAHRLIVVVKPEPTLVSRRRA